MISCIFPLSIYCHASFLGKANQSDPAHCLQIMKPLFTVHAGEYRVGSHIEARYSRWNIWLPAKDTGVDQLVTNGRNKKNVSLQVKFSKDFTPTHRTILQGKLVAGGWWTLQEAKIQNSRADFWIFVLPSLTEHEIPSTTVLRSLWPRPQWRCHTHGSLPVCCAEDTCCRDR